MAHVKFPSDSHPDGRDFATFEQFWPHYVRAHAHRSTRALHAAGTVLGVCATLAGLTSRRRRWLLAVAPLVGYGPAWLGHFLIEGNVPATFKHPLWSLRADLLMLGKMLAGTMDAEVEAALAEDAPGAAGDTAPGVGANGSNGSNGRGHHGGEGGYRVASSEPSDPGALN